MNPRSEDPGAPVSGPLSSTLRDPVDEASIPRMWRRIEERRRAPSVPFRTMLGFASLGAALAVVAMLVVSTLSDRLLPRHAPGATADPGPLLLLGGSPLPTLHVDPGARPAVLDLSDGSRLTLESRARLAPLVSTGHEVLLRLIAGKATFDIRPGGPRHWKIEAGIASVEVVGTRFSVDREATGVRVEVTRGAVLVRGQTVPDGVLRLEAGGAVDVRAAALSEAASPVAPDVVGPALPSASPPRAASSPGWREAATLGDYTDAYGALGAEGLSRETTRAGSADDLFALADVARLSGHPAEAVAPLERLLADYRSSSRASLAAVTLGRIELGLGAPRPASVALELALALGVPAGLEEDVYVRLVEAHVRAGNRSAAEAAAAAYARHVPGGRRRADVARWLSR